MTRDKNMTKSSEAPRLFVDEGLLKELVRSAVQNLLEEEVARHLGAGPYERAEGRRGHRNGTKPRTMRTAVGRLDLEVPQVREGGFRTQLFERWQRSDKALVAAMQEMVVAGVSTRRVSDVMEEMGGFEVSAATVSRTMAELDAQISAFFSRKLTECEYPYLIVDARYEKVRKSGRVVSQAVLIVAGIRDDGRREFLSLMVGDSESAEEEALLRKKWAGWLKESRHDDLLAELEENRRKTRSKAKREKLRLAIGYIERGRERMDYASYVAEGLPIGSGPIEAACKHLLKERYAIAGARWSRVNSGNVLALRLAIANGEWELY